MTGKRDLTFILILVIVLYGLNVYDSIQINNMKQSLNKVEPIVNMQCDKIIPYAQFGKYHLVCWNGNISDHTPSEKQVIRSWHSENGIDQPKPDRYINRE